MQWHRVKIKAWLVQRMVLRDAGLYATLGGLDFILQAMGNFEPTSLHLVHKDIKRGSVKCLAEIQLHYVYGTSLVFQSSSPCGPGDATLGPVISRFVW